MHETVATIEAIQATGILGILGLLGYGIWKVSAWHKEDVIDRERMIEFKKKACKGIQENREATQVNKEALIKINAILEGRDGGS